MKRTTILFFVLLFAPMTIRAQDMGNANVASIKGVYDTTTRNLTATAQMLTQEQYAYKPTDVVRSAGHILAHVADAQYLFCSAAAGKEAPEMESVEETKTSKADIIAALKAAFAYCDAVFDGLNDESSSAMRTFFGQQMTALGVLAFNTAHNYEHYGNLVTYMRENDLVPPSSQGQ